MKKDSSLGLIVLNNMKDFGNKVFAHLKEEHGISENCLIPHQEVRFSNGEGKVVINSTVRDKNIYILSDITNYNCSYQAYGRTNYLSPDDHFQDIKRVVSAIRGNSKKITVIMPFLYGSRQHARNGRESLDCAVALQELQHLGISTIATFDAHDPEVQNAIPLLSFDNFFPTNTILTEFVEKEKINYDKLLIISPDEGALKRCRYYSGMLEADIGLFYKRRDYSKLVNGKNPIAEHKYLGREEEGLDYIIVDDMISSGGSMIDIFEQLKERKANKVYAVAAFSLLTDGPKPFDDAYEKGLFTKIYTTELAYIPNEIKEKPWLEVVDTASLVSDIIDSYHYEKSISPLLNGKEEMFKTILKAKKEQLEEAKEKQGKTKVRKP